MRVLLQRVTKASVSVDGKIIGQIENGLAVFVGIKNGDDEKTAKYMAEKIVNLRLFEDEDGKTNLSSLDTCASILAISQFTLYADCRRGRRPGFTEASRPEFSKPLYEKFIEFVKEFGLHVAGGEFGAHMLVEIHNDGPFTIFLDSDDKRTN